MMTDPPMQPLAASSDTTTRFDTLFAHFYPDLYGLARRVLGDSAEAEDVLQETFLRLARLADASDPLLVRPDVEIGAWLRRVCLNLGFNRLRERRRSQARLERVGRLEAVGRDGSPGPAQAVERQEEQDRVRAVLAELPERQRETLLLRHAGYAYVEIAETLGIAIGSVGVLLARAERAFKERWLLEVGSQPSGGLIE